MDKDLEIVERHCAQLAEHFETVQILVTRHEGAEGGTINCDFGAGNWFARKGQMIEWLTKNEEGTRERTRQRERDED